MDDESVDLTIYPKLVELISSFPTAQYARALTLLGIPDEVADGARHASDLATAIGAHQETLTRFLRACAMIGLLTEPEPDVFGTTPMGALLRSDSMFFGMTRATAGMHHYLPYTKIVECVRTGRSMGAAALGATFYDYLQDRPDELLYYYQLTALTAGDVGTAVAKEFDFSRFGVIVDVGGRFGSLLAQILNATPGVRGVLYDTPAILPAARRHFAEQGLGDRVELRGGDIARERPPADGDLYVLNTILWETDDERAQRILRNVAAAMRPEATLLIIENFLPELSYEPGQELDERSRELHRVNFSVFLQRGGRVRTEAEYRGLLTDAGFAVRNVTGVEGTSRYWNLIEARPV